MTDPRSTIWRLVECAGYEARGEDLIEFNLESGPRKFTVTVLGPSNLSNHDVMNALRAALAYWARGNGLGPDALDSGISLSPNQKLN